MEFILAPANAPDLARPGSRGPYRAAVSGLRRLVLEGAGEREMIDEAVRAAATALGVELSHFLELCPNGEALIWRSAVGWPSHMIGTTTAPAGIKSSFAGFVLAAGGPVVANDLRSEARFTPAPLIEELAVVRGIATVVRGCRGEPLGVLACHSRDQDAFSENDTTSLQAIADILSVGLLRRHETDRFEALVKNSADLIAVIDKKGEVTYCNAGAFRIFGRSPATLIGKSLWGFLHPDDHDSARKAFATAVSRPGAQVFGFLPAEHGGGRLEGPRRYRHKLHG